MQNIISTTRIVNTTDDPATLEPGIYFMGSTSFDTEYFPTSNIWGILNVYEAVNGSYYKTYLLIDSDNSYIGFINMDNITKITWKKITN